MSRHHSRPAPSTSPSQPQVRAPRWSRHLVPPPQFARATLETYAPDPAYPVAARGDGALRRSRGGWRAREAGRALPRRRRRPETEARASTSTADSASARPTCSRRSGTRCRRRRKYFGTFIEYTALVGALGYAEAVEQFRGATCSASTSSNSTIPGDTMVMTRLLGELVASGHPHRRDVATRRRTRWARAGSPRRTSCARSTRCRPTSRPCASTAWTTASATSTGTPGAEPTTPTRGDRGCRGTGVVSDDAFDDAHRPPRPRAPVALHRAHRRARRRRAFADVHRSTDQSDALRFVAFVDRALRRPGARSAPRACRSTRCSPTTCSPAATGRSTCARPRA